MRIAATGATLLLLLQACSTTETSSNSPFQQPNSLMAGEITRRVEQIPYQHRDELLQNLMWLAQTGEQTVPAVLDGMRHENPKVRSSCAWVLGRIRDRRTIPNLQSALRDGDPSVRLEVARSLVTMGDLQPAPSLIEGLDSDKKEVRYMCHEALKTASGHDFGYDHLNQSETELRLSVLRWRQWWSEYSGDTYFAQSYQRAHNLQPQLAAPAGETKPNTNGANNTANQGDAMSTNNADAPMDLGGNPAAQNPAPQQPQGSTTTNPPAPSNSTAPSNATPSNPANTTPNSSATTTTTPNTGGTPSATNPATAPMTTGNTGNTAPSTAPNTATTPSATPANTPANTNTNTNTNTSPATKPATTPATKPVTAPTAPASRTNG
jgi:hypothetical protein